MAGLMTVIGIAVAVLYSDTGKAHAILPGSAQRSEFLCAVPSDAAAVVCFSDKEKGRRMLPSWVEFDEDFSPKVVSLHFNGSFVPLFIAKGDKENPVSIRSSSETLVASSQRHLSEGLSILTDDSFNALSSRFSDRNVIYFSNEYALRLIPSWLGKEYSFLSPLVSTLSEWMAFALDEDSDKKLSFQGVAECGKSDAFFMNVLKSQGNSDARITEVLPSSTSFALSIQISDIVKYEDAYLKFLDASQKLSSFNDATLGWAENLGIREVSLAKWKTVDGEDVWAVLLRQAKASEESGTIVDNGYKSYASNLFGPVFSVPDESKCAYVGDWVVYGSEKAVNDIVLASTQGDYYDYTNPSVLITYQHQRFNVEKIMQAGSGVRKSGGGMTARVEIPKGPFEVKNSGTGKINLFYQNDNMYLCLKEKDGAGLWGVTFNEPICGCVGMVDYYKNGKLQYLFAAGSKIYLIDRLGRFVTGFPYDTGSDILLGPAVYDFSLDGEYTLMVLHKDNTIGMYNIHGQKVSGWKGIGPQDTVLSLPSLKQDGENRYWIVQTARQTEVYDFWGGEQLKGKAVKNLVE